MASRQNSSLKAGRGYSARGTSRGRRLRVKTAALRRGEAALPGELREEEDFVSSSLKAGRGCFARGTSRGRRFRVKTAALRRGGAALRGDFVRKKKFKRGETTSCQNNSLKAGRGCFARGTSRGRRLRVKTIALRRGEAALRGELREEEYFVSKQQP
ncbi:hypothetical protein ACLB2K_006331 [Fragaria x ananassa]